MDKEEKFDLITRGLDEVVDEEKINGILAERDLKIYWGTAPTGNPHFGYFVPIFKIADFLKAGCQVKILFANMHAYLDNMKTSWELLDYRTQYYEYLIKEMLKIIGVPLDKLEFIRGTDFQLSREYTLDMYKLTALSSTKETIKAGSEVVKQLENPKLSGLLYPILQGLDEVYLDVDAQFGGLDQRKIFMYAREFLPKIGYEKRSHLMTPLIPGLTESGKMSSSEPYSKIDFHDSDKQIQKKIQKAFSVDGVVEGNGLLSILKHIIFHKLEYDGRDFVVERPEKYGGTITFTSYDEVEKSFADKELSSIDLKQAVAKEVISFITPLRERLEEVSDLFAKAYPELNK